MSGDMFLAGLSASLGVCVGTFIFNFVLQLFLSLLGEDNKE